MLWQSIFWYGDMHKASCAIMFADVSGSTKLYDELGDEAAKKIMDKCLRCLQTVTESHKGTVIKEIGDELMCRFDTPFEAISAAKVSQSEIRSLQVDANIQLSIRVGIHYGDVIVEESDIFGDAVNLAARMAGIARAGQIITTKETVESLPPEMNSDVRQVDLTQVKGKLDKIGVYEVLWEQNNEFTKMATQLLARAISTPSKLEIRLGSESFAMEDEAESISMGRDNECTLTLDSTLASRKHAVCHRRRGKFLISDQSTNGTYVSTPNGDELYLRREDLVLQGQGHISLGKPIAETDASMLIEYKC